jgi:excisionase family DNA binding protein
MTRPRLPIEPVSVPLHRRGGARGTGAASGSPPVDHAEPWLLDSREVARLLGISRTKTFQMMAGAELPVIRVGRCVRVPRTDLEIWIAQRTATPSGGASPDSRKPKVHWGASAG